MDGTVFPAYGEGAILGSLLMEEVCSETEREVGELVSEVAHPPEESTGHSNELLLENNCWPIMMMHDGSCHSDWCEI